MKSTEKWMRVVEAYAKEKGTEIDFKTATPERMNGFLQLAAFFVNVRQRNGKVYS